MTELYPNIGDVDEIACDLHRALGVLHRLYHAAAGDDPAGIRLDVRTAVTSIRHILYVLDCRGVSPDPSSLLTLQRDLRNRGIVWADSLAGPLHYTVRVSEFDPEPLLYACVQQPPSPDVSGYFMDCPDGVREIRFDIVGDTARAWLAAYAVPVVPPASQEVLAHD